MLAERISCNFPNVALANFGPHFLDVLGNASFSAYIFVGSAPFAKHIPRFPTRHDEATHDDLPKLVGKFFKKSPPGCGQRLFFLSRELAWNVRSHSTFLDMYIYYNKCIVLEV